MKQRSAWEIFVWCQVRLGFKHIWWGICGAWFIIGGGMRPGATLQPAWKRWLRIPKWSEK